MPTVLVVDDDWAIGDVLQAVLSAQGYEVVCVLDAKRALATLQQRRVDIILLDVTMPIMSGSELLCRLKRSEAHRAIPVVLMTAVNDEALLRVDRSLVAAVLHKPFSFDVLRAALSDVAQAAAVGQ